MFYSEQQAREAGHPWQGGVGWGSVAAENQLIEDVGEFVCCVVIGGFVLGLMVLVTVASVPVWGWRKFRGTL